VFLKSIGKSRIRDKRGRVTGLGAGEGNWSWGLIFIRILKKGCVQVCLVGINWGLGVFLGVFRGVSTGVFFGVSGCARCGVPPKHWTLIRELSFMFTLFGFRIPQVIYNRASCGASFDCNTLLYTQRLGVELPPLEGSPSLRAIRF
jgi:hypothetical protein